MSPSAATLPNREKKKKRKKKQSSLLMWWPLAVGIAFTPLAIRAADVLALQGPWGLRLLFPYVQLLVRPELGLSEEMGRNLSQLMMYAQFPLYGLLAALTLRAKALKAAALQTLVVHMAGVLILWMLTDFIHHTVMQ